MSEQSTQMRQDLPPTLNEPVITPDERFAFRDWAVDAGAWVLEATDTPQPSGEGPEHMSAHRYSYGAREAFDAAFDWALRAKLYAPSGELVASF